MDVNRRRANKAHKIATGTETPASRDAADGGRFQVVTDYVPRGHQPAAIRALSRGIEEGLPGQVLLGVTGSGKTATMAWTIERVQRPTLVIAPNKTLAAQLCSEFKEFFPHNAVEFFVSYYDYYQPEAYVPSSDTYIEKDVQINEEIEKLRHSATMSLFERRDVIIVASVSCIYSLGSPDEYHELVVSLRVGGCHDRDEVCRRLVDIQYERNDVNFVRGKFRVRGDVLEVYPASATERAVRVEFLGEEIERIVEFDVLTGEVTGERGHISIYPNSHYVAAPDRLEHAMAAVEVELEERLAELRAQDLLLEAQRLEQRTRYDLEMLREVGFCPGVENYSRHLTGRAPGEAPYTLLDFFPEDFLVVIDESHVTVPQLRAMYRGDRSRKENLVRYGFRLPSAVDNRPLMFEEFCGRVPRVVWVSATPGDYELEQAGRVVEQIVRPTGLIDPPVQVRPIEGQIDDLLGEIRQTVDRGWRVLVTTLTKRMAEELTDYLREVGVRTRYMHSDVDTLERMEIIRGLRLGEFDVLVGINLLREGLDLPEVALVAILDADKEGYLRSARSLIQTTGRTARNVEGRVIMYADKITDSMRRAIDETNRRRAIQEEYNREHGITPKTVTKAVRDVLEATRVVRQPAEYLRGKSLGDLPQRDIPALVDRLRAEMLEAARELEYERAALLRDMIVELQGARKAAGGTPRRRRG